MANDDGEAGHSTGYSWRNRRSDINLTMQVYMRLRLHDQTAAIAAIPPLRQHFGS